MLDPKNDARMKRIADASTALMNRTLMDFTPTADAYTAWLASVFLRHAACVPHLCLQKS